MKMIIAAATIAAGLIFAGGVALAGTSSQEGLEFDTPFVSEQCHADTSADLAGGAAVAGTDIVAQEESSWRELRADDSGGGGESDGGSDRGSDKGSDSDSGGGSDNGSDKGSDGGSEKGSGGDSGGGLDGGSGGGGCLPCTVRWLN